MLCGIVVSPAMGRDIRMSTCKLNLTLKSTFCSPVIYGPLHLLSTSGCIEPPDVLSQHIQSEWLRQLLGS